MDVDGRQAGAVVGNFDMLHAPPLDVFRRVAEANNAAHIGIEAFLVLRLQEALADVIIAAGTMEVLCAARGVALGDALPAGVFHLARLARPLAEPRIVIAGAVPQAQSDA